LLCLVKVRVGQREPFPLQSPVGKPAMQVCFQYIRHFAFDGEQQGQLVSRSGLKIRETL
jgi:hypothetical protein